MVPATLRLFRHLDREENPRHWSEIRRDELEHLLQLAAQRHRRVALVAAQPEFFRSQAIDRLASLVLELFSERCWLILGDIQGWSGIASAALKIPPRVEPRADAVQAAGSGERM